MAVPGRNPSHLSQLWFPSWGDETKNSASFSGQVRFFHYEASGLTSFGEGPKWQYNGEIFKEVIALKTPLAQPSQVSFLR
jgi:hypothetical protein